MVGGGFTSLWAAIQARQAKPDCAMIKLSTDGEPVSEERTFDMLAAAHALRDFCAAI